MAAIGSEQAIDHGEEVAGGALQLLGEGFAVLHQRGLC
jgi:hypothetical protein